MLIHPQFNPIAVSLGPLKVHWYGLTYLVAFVAAYLLGVYRARQQPFVDRGWTRQHVEDLLFFAMLGVVLGGRLGYVLFYKPSFYFSHPMEIFAVWQGGMAFHGGLLGVITAMAVFAKRQGRHFFEVADLVAPCVPIGLAAGRIGNFINGELWGRVTSPDAPWAMVFPRAQDGLPRHPSQLYEFATEGLLLFIVIWLFTSKPRPTGQATALFIMGYGLARFTVEFTREPDNFLGFLSLGLSMGQWLSLPMILVGAALWVWASRQAAVKPGQA